MTPTAGCEVGLDVGKTDGTKVGSVVGDAVQLNCIVGRFVHNRGGKNSELHALLINVVFFNLYIHLHIMYVYMHLSYTIVLSYVPEGLAVGDSVGEAVGGTIEFKKHIRLFVYKTYRLHIYVCKYTK